MAVRLTDTVIKGLAARERVYVEWDTEVGGLGVKVFPSGTKSFILDYRTNGGRQHRFTLGAASEWKTSVARDRAKELKRGIRHDGVNPVQELREEREAPTFRDAWDRFEREQKDSRPEDKLRPSTWSQYSSLANRYLLPKLGGDKVADITSDHIDKMYRKIAKRAQASAAVILAKAIFNLTIKWGWRETNPCFKVAITLPPKRKRKLSTEERGRLVKAVAAHDDREAADILSLLMLTGCRRNEVLGAKWGEIDFKTKLWTLPGHRTKTHETRDVVLTPLVLSILSRLREAADDDAIYVFPGAGKTDHREGVRKDWDVIRKTAKLEDFRLHDLRRSFASVGVSAGLSLEQIGQLLGHATAETTRGYAWLMSESRDQAAATIAAIISGQPKAKVVSMKRRPRQNG